MDLSNLNYRERALALLLSAAMLVVSTLIMPAVAADNGGPRRVDALGYERPMFANCYLGAGLGGVAMTAAGNGVTAMSVGVDVGCDAVRGNIVFGLNAGYDFGEGSAKFASLGGRVGYLINPSTVAYVPIKLTMDGDSPKLDNSILSIGVGIETFAFTPHTTIGIEALKDVKGFGDARDIGDAWSARAFWRYRFN